MANICSTSIVIEGSKETLDKILNAVKNHETEEKTCWEYGGNILCALGIKPNDFDNYGCMSSFEEVEPTEDKDVFKLRLEWEDRWMRGEFVEKLQEAFPDIAIYWNAEEFGCEYWETNDWDGKYFSNRFAVVSDEDWEYFETEDNMLNYLKENFDIDSLDEIEDYNENNEDGNTVTVYECEEE